MGKNNKKGNKANVFKVAGAKSLKKTKAKAVNLGLKNIKQKVEDIDKQFLEMKKNPKSNQPILKTETKAIPKQPEHKVSKDEIFATAVQIDKMDL